MREVTGMGIKQHPMRSFMGLVIVGVAVGVALSTNDIKRYLKIRSM